MRVALLSCNAQAGDAVGNQVAEKLAFFLDGGADVRVFVESDRRLHPAVRPHCQVLARPDPTGEAWEFLSSADLVVVEYSQHYLLLGLVPLLARGRPRLVLDYHGITPRELWGNHNHEALEQGIRYRGLVWCADAALVHSRFMLRELTRETALPAERVRSLPHPADPARFSPGAEWPRLRKALGLDHASVLLFVGRVAVNKRLPVLVEAVAELREREPPVHALVVGDATDLYQGEARRCRRRAAELGVADRLHFLGQVDEDELLAAYRSADVFVMPSRHEGFCIPVVEAMACGVPVVAARAAALPETVAGAGLTFEPDDAKDLARQVRRVFDSTPAVRCHACAAPADAGSLSGSRRGRESVPSLHAERLRVAVVSFRYGADFAGGAERSLRTIALNLHAAGHAVEVFTTCATGESDWKNELPEGTSWSDAIPVHRFRIDAHDRARHLESVRAVLQAEGPVGEDAERDYLAHSVHCARLIESLDGRIKEFDAVLVGPYLHGLTFDVARAFPDRTLLLGCFHDEPFARLRSVVTTYGGIGGVLYHSPEEQDLAEAELGLNHPRGCCVGTFVEGDAGDPERGRACVGEGRRYLVYCGRYSQQKGLPTLLEHAARYHGSHPGRFTFVFLGEGEVAIPRAAWARDLGFVAEAVKRDLLAGADALLLPSQRESLSLAALEAWEQRTPVLADEGSAVLVGHLRRGSGGRAVTGYEAFAAALDELWERPEVWRDLGRQGQAYVRTRYADRAAFVAMLETAVRSLDVPLAECMARRGRERAVQLDRSNWRVAFSRLVEEVLDAPTRPWREDISVRPRARSRTALAGTGGVLVPVRVVNRGTHSVLPDGPAAVAIRCTVTDEAGAALSDGDSATPLPGVLMPGRALSAAVLVPVSPAPGTYRVVFSARSQDGQQPASEAGNAHVTSSDEELRLVVGRAGERADAGCCVPLLEAVKVVLAEAHRKQRLPDDYVDVTEGWLAVCKRWVKRKLLANFKRAYVDVLSRQQSAVNQALVNAVQELAECCATLDHATRRPAARDSAVAWENLTNQLAESRRRCAALEERLARLEAMFRDEPVLAPQPGP